MIPKEAIEAFYSKAEVQTTGTILNMEAALTAAFAAMSEPVAEAALSIAKNALANAARRIGPLTIEDMADVFGNISKTAFSTAPQPAAVKGFDVDKLAEAISRAACELDDIPDPEGEDTIIITARDLEAIVHRHVRSALEGGGE